MTKYAMIVDLNRCQGCRACMEACKIENNTSEAMFWMYVFRFEEGTYPDTRMSFLPRPCQHCDNAPCVKVCPTGSRFKREDGIVLTDPDRCIGCRYCELACPYGVNYFNWQKPQEAQYAEAIDWSDPDIQDATQGAVPPYKNPALDELWGTEQRRTAGGSHAKGVMEKCTFCVHRVEEGGQPACVETCPVTALRFGDVDDPDTPISRFIREHETWHLLEEAGTEPNVLYVGGKPPSHGYREVERPKARV
ncbi:MAG TPA: 4Fe-4S dicluster domain-containing protein [Acidimicrobiia bacterium]|jgi:molybdopterin-containing oxidoreductase family iron-sulfur binding subunit|nr:4Fe-4S dicluster domain-containing protein [Acidimicrobiia bacterium]